MFSLRERKVYFRMKLNLIKRKAGLLSLLTLFLDPSCQNQIKIKIASKLYFLFIFLVVVSVLLLLVVYNIWQDCYHLINVTTVCKLGIWYISVQFLRYL